MAAIVWISGGVILVLKGYSVLAGAKRLNPQLSWPWIAAFSGILLGLLRSKVLFVKSCKKNLQRIEALNTPRAWQFYKPWFFAALALMILLGAVITRAAEGNYVLLNIVGMVDLSIGAGLILSAPTFWTKGPRP